MCQPLTNSNSTVRSPGSNLHRPFQSPPEIQIQTPNQSTVNLFPSLSINLPFSLYKSITLDTISVSLSPSVSSISTPWLSTTSFLYSPATMPTCRRNQPGKPSKKPTRRSLSWSISSFDPTPTSAPSRSTLKHSGFSRTMRWFTDPCPMFRVFTRSSTRYW